LVKKRKGERTQETESRSQEPEARIFPLTLTLSHQGERGYD